MCQSITLSSTRWLKAPATARASFWVYNDESEVDALEKAVEQARTRFGVSV